MLSNLLKDKFEINHSKFKFIKKLTNQIADNFENTIMHYRKRAIQAIDSEN